MNEMNIFRRDIKTGRRQRRVHASVIENVTQSKEAVHLSQGSAVVPKHAEREEERAPWNFTEKQRKLLLIIPTLGRLTDTPASSGFAHVSVVTLLLLLLLLTVSTAWISATFLRHAVQGSCPNSCWWSELEQQCPGVSEGKNKFFS